MQLRGDSASFSLPVGFESLSHSSTVTKEGIKVGINVTVFRGLRESGVIKMHRRLLDTIKELKNESFALMDCASEGILVPGLPIGRLSLWNEVKQKKKNARKMLTTFWHR